MRLLVCGDRDWVDREYLYRILSEACQIKRIVRLIEGEARGADRMAAEWAKSWGIRVEPYPALWKKHGKAAGPIRNRQMILESKPDFCFAFHADIEKSKGTKDMLYACGLAGVPWELFPQ